MSHTFLSLDNIIITSGNQSNILIVQRGLVNYLQHTNDDKVNIDEYLSTIVTFISCNKSK